MKVPYQPIPDVAPANIPTPSINVSTPPDAFGVGIGNAIRQLGGTVEKVGDELWNRATAMQQLRNETESTEAITQYEKDAGTLHANFSSLQGKNAVDGFQTYQDSLDSKRQSIREGLSNDMVRKLYDRSANSIMGRSIFNGAGHAATQNKVSVDGSLSARNNSLHDTILQNPGDNQLYSQSLQEIRDNVDAQGAIRGWGADQIAQEKAKQISAAMRSKIDGINREHPFKAKEMLEQNRQFMHSTDIEHLEPKIQNQIRIVGQRNISDAVNKGWAPYMTPGAISRADGVQEPLVRIIQEAQKAHPELQFTVGGKGGVRTPEEQARLVAQGVSKTLQSDHLSAKAIDIVPVINGKEDYKADYGPYIRAVEEASAKLGIPLRTKSEEFKSWDPGHFALPGDYDTGSAPKKVDEPAQSRIDRAERYAKNLFPDDPLFPDLVRNRVEVDYSKAKSISRETNLDNNETVNQGIIDRGDGKPATNMDELLANAKSKAAFDALRPDQQIAVASRIKSYNSATAQRTEQADLFRLKGMAQENPEEFLKIDPLDKDLKLSQADRKSIFSLQQNIRKQPEKLPQVARALSILSPIISDPDRGISKKDDPDKYWEFVGSLQDALEYETKRSGGKPPGFKEIEEIGKRLLYTQPSTSWFRRGEPPLFDAGSKLSGFERDAIRTKLMKDHPNVIFTDRDIDREVARQLYIKRFGGTR